MTVVTEEQVLEGALAHFKRSDSFTESAYLTTESGRNLIAAGPEVYATCAVGGLEQAFWQLTGKTLGRGRRHVRDRRNAYGRSLALCNEVARRLYPKDPDGGKNTTMEQITFYGTTLAAKRRVLKVLRTALAEVRS